MKKIIFLFVFLYTIIASAQILEPVKWEFESQKINEGEYELTFIATIDEHWAVYSQFVDDGGPIPTEFTFEENEAFSLVNSVIEADENKVTKHDPVFDMIVSKFYNKAVFKQKVKLNNSDAIVKGSLVFMTCDDERCLAPTDVPFEFNLSFSGKDNLKSIFGNTTNQILEPVNWQMTTKKISDEEYDLVFTAKMDYKWAIYSQFLEEEGPLPTVFVFEESDKYELVERVIESDKNKVTKHDPVFDIVVSKFYDEAIFTQRIKIKSEKFDIRGNIEYMTCDDKQCIFIPDNPFTFDYTKTSGLVVVEENKTSNIVVVDESVNTTLYGISPNDITRSDLKCENAYT
ncbi:MAG: hypothetical protein IMY67_10810, partial [Bacteroidetes bacterium]|nr:hypothetical protein [Bacteroidota bacterium]